MTANIVNSGTPLSPGASAPLWTDQCDASSNFINTPAPADMVIPINGASGPGAINLPVSITALDQIDQVIVTGTMRGRRGDTLSLTLKHEIYGTIPLIVSHDIRGTLTVPYPLPNETRTFLFGETIPPGYIFQSYISPSSSFTITLPEGQAPTDYYFNYLSGGYSWQVKGRIAGAPAYQITVPAHRYPYAPTYNYDFQPAFGLIQQSVPIVYRGFRYRMLSPMGGDPVAVNEITFVHHQIDTGNPAVGSGENSTGFDPWNDFTGVNLGFSGYLPFTEKLFADYGAHDWLVKSAYQVRTNYNVGASAFFKVDQFYTVRFIRWPDIIWSVEALDQITWESIIPALARYQFYPTDYGDYQDYAERSESLTAVGLDWSGKAADGVWTMEYAATSPVPLDSSPTVAEPLISPTVAIPVVRIDNLVITIKFKTNPQFANTVLSPTVVGGVTTVTTQGNLRSAGDDRALIGILAGISNSTSMGIFCGYALQRIGRTGELYNIAYFVATTCNLNHVNMTRRKAFIEYLGKDWGDVPFSTKGDAGESYVIGNQPWKIFPVRGQIGLKLTVTGSTLTLRLLGTDYPPLTFVDPTVANITNYQKISLNS